MIDTTPTLGLKKDDENEFYSIPRMNGNWDKVDTEGAAVRQQLSPPTAKTAPAAADYLVLDDSADAHKKKRLTWGNITTSLKGLFYTEAEIDAKLTDISNAAAQKASTATYTVTIPAAWVGTGPYTQTISVPGILASDNPMVDIVLTGTASTDEARLEGWGLVSRIVTSAGSIAVTCYEDKPEVALPIQMKVVR